MRECNKSRTEKLHLSMRDKFKLRLEIDMHEKED